MRLESTKFALVSAIRFAYQGVDRRQICIHPMRPCSAHDAFKLKPWQPGNKILGGENATKPGVYFFPQERSQSTIDLIESLLGSKIQFGAQHRQRHCSHWRNADATQHTLKSRSRSPARYDGGQQNAKRYSALEQQPAVVKGLGLTCGALS